jgi:hypothetical protein
VEEEEGEEEVGGQEEVEDGWGGRGICLVKKAEEYKSGKERETTS